MVSTSNLEQTWPPWLADHFRCKVHTLVAALCACALIDHNNIKSMHANISTFNRLKKVSCLGNCVSSCLNGAL